jgi:hypothetical protein
MEIKLTTQQFKQYIITNRAFLTTSDVEYKFAWLLKLNYNKISKPNYSVLPYAGYVDPIIMRGQYYFD